MRVALILCASIYLVSLSGCCSLPNREEHPSSKDISYEEIKGKWSAVVTDHGFGSSVLVADFEKSGFYTFTWIGPLSLASQTDGSQPVLGTVQEGKYHISGNVLHLESSHPEQCTITLHENLLILAFNENRIYNLMKSSKK